MNVGNSHIVGNVTQVAVKPVSAIKSVTIVLSYCRRSITFAFARGAEKCLNLCSQ